MHPYHEQYSRNPTANSLRELFDLLDGLESGLRDEVLLRASEIVDPFIDPRLLGDQPIYLVFREACQRLCEVHPEDVVVRHIVSHTLWLLLHYSGYSDSRRRAKDRKQKEERQLALFVTATPQQIEDDAAADNDPVYELFCELVLRPLLQETVRSFDQTKDEDLAFLALCEMRGVGYWTLRKLVKNGLLRYLFHLDSFEEFVGCLRSAGAKVADREFNRAGNWRDQLFDNGRRLLEDLKSLNVTFIPQSHSTFPGQLRDVDDPPLWLFVQGDTTALAQRSVAVVGTRQPSPEGMRLAGMVGDCLPDFESAIVSGLAEGIDQVMHLSSIHWHIPTIAVLGTGILSNYPSGSEVLREQIYMEGGAVITEYLPRDSYSAKNFVRRNRIQAGLASVVIPVQWREKSGTAHTVRFAYEAKRGIVCPRLPHWNDQQHSELIFAKQMGAEVFTLPDEQAQFIAAVRRQRGEA